ncbi:MAG: fused MFS/spermidine synthase, partial [Pseudomonadota bacterium]
MTSPGNPSNSLDRLMFSGVVACFVLSGFAALLYQTAWMRQFSLVFGTSELAVAAVLSAYMGGLATGAAVAARWVGRVQRPVLVYGILEAGIALTALAVPWLLQGIHALYVSVFGGQPEPVDASGLGQSVFYLAAAFIVLMLPTSFMGATLPLLTKYAVHSDEQVGPRVGILYATNTLGAVGGTVVAGFLLLPALGLLGTVYVGIGINLLVFVIAAMLARTAAAVPDSSATDALDIELTAQTGFARRRLILPLMLLSGANAFVYEVLWTRLLGHVLGGSVAAFATMLASFLAGITLGSAIASRFA